MTKRRTRPRTRRSAEEAAKERRSQKLDDAMDSLKTMMDKVIDATNASERLCWENATLNLFINGMSAKEAGDKADELVAEWRKRWAPSSAQLHDITRLIANKKPARASRRKG